MVICLERGADLHIAQLMPLPLTVSCFSKIQIGFTYLVPAHPVIPGQRAVKRVCVCVCVLLVKTESIFLIGEHMAKSQAQWLTVSYTPLALDVYPQRFRTRQISKIACI